MNKFTSTVLLSLALLFGFECLAFKFSDVWKVEVGMKKADVIRILGSPNQVIPRTSGAGGDEAWLWIDSGVFRRKSVTIVFTGDRVSQIPPRGKVISEKEWQAQGQEALERAKAIQAAEDELKRKEFADTHTELDPKTRDGLVAGTMTVAQAQSKLEEDRIVAKVTAQVKQKEAERLQRETAFEFRGGQSFSDFSGRIPPPGPERPFEWVWIPRITNQMPGDEVVAIMGEPSAKLADSLRGGSSWIWHFRSKEGKTNVLTFGFKSDRVRELPIYSLGLDEDTERAIRIERGKIEGAQYAAQHPDIDPDLKAALLSGRLSVVTVEIEQEIRIRKRNYIAAHPNLKPSRKQEILNGQVKIGMTKGEVEACWGKPKTINKTVNALGTHDQWVYGNTYFYFENGTLTTLQTSESFER